MLSQRASLNPSAVPCWSRDTKTVNSKLLPMWHFRAHSTSTLPVIFFIIIKKKSFHNAGETQISTYQIRRCHCQSFCFVGHDLIQLRARTPHQKASTPYAVTSRPATSHGLSLPVPKGSLTIATHRKGKWLLWLKQNLFLTLLSNSVIWAAI